jgi:mannitol/fructose-specific phosphotransferase system IIA component (Ntr-type)
MSFWRRLRGESSMIERLMLEGQGITVVVLDTKAIYASETINNEISSNTVGNGHPNPEIQALSSSRVLIWNKEIEKDEAIRQLLDMCCKDGDMNKETAWKDLLEREQKGGTFVGEDVAIPHIRIHGINRARVAVGISKAGFYDPDSGRHARIMFLLLSPLEPPGSHVTMLGLICRIARDDQWRKAVLSANKPSDVIGMINKNERLKL